MLWSSEEIKETIRMVKCENFDIRTVTLGLSMRGIKEGGGDFAARCGTRIIEAGKNFLKAVGEVQELYGIPIVNRRISVTPVAIFADGLSEGGFIQIAKTMDRAAKEVGVDYIAGYGALVEKGMTEGDRVLISTIPRALSETERVCSCINVASTKAGINMDAVRLMGETISDLARRDRARNGMACARLVVFANAPSDNPFIAGSFHGVEEGEKVVNIGISGPGVILSAIENAKMTTRNLTFTDLSETIKRMVFKITRAGELIGQEVVKRLGQGYSFGSVDLSLAPTPAIGDSVAKIIEVMGIERAGAPGSTCALALLTDAVKKGGVMGTSFAGGLSGAFIPVSEDSGMVEAVIAGALSIEKLEAMTSVSSTGLDMITIPGETPPYTISAIIADEMAVGIINNKAVGVRIIPVPGKKEGDIVHFGGLLGSGCIMRVSKFSSERFMSITGRIPPPIISMRN